MDRIIELENIINFTTKKKKKNCYFNLIQTVAFFSHKNIKFLLLYFKRSERRLMHFSTLLFLNFLIEFPTTLANKTNIFCIHLHTILQRIIFP